MLETRKAVAVSQGETLTDEFETFTRKVFGQFESALSAFNNSVEDGRKFSHVSCSESTLSLRFRYGRRGYEMTGENPEIYLNWQTGATSWDVLHFLVLEADGAGQMLVGLDGAPPASLATRKLVQKLFGAVVSAPELDGVDDDEPDSADSEHLNNNSDFVGHQSTQLQESPQGNAPEQGLRGLFGQEFADSPIVDDGIADTGLSKLFESAIPNNHDSGNSKADYSDSDNSNSVNSKHGATNQMLTTQASSLEDAIVNVREVLQSELQNCAHQGSRAFEAQDMQAVAQAMNKLNKMKGLEAKVIRETDEWLEQLA